jgi:heme-degrading monooxygenase HmoA
VTVVSVLRIAARDGTALAAAFARLEIFEHSRRSGGFRGGRLLRPVEEGAPYVVVAEWDGADDYQRWLVNPVRAELGEQLGPLVDGDVAAGEVFEEIS